MTPSRLVAPVPPGAHAWTVDVNGTRLQAWDWGRDDGPNVLLVHGRNGAASQLAAFVEPLVAAGFHVTAFDQPAHGLSEGDRATLLDLRDAVRAVAARLQPLHAIVAHSLGATATTLALAGGLSADRVVLMAPPAELTFFARAFAASLGLAAPATDAMLAAIQRKVGVAFETLDVRRRARGLHTPALILHDLEDREVPFAHGRGLAEAWPGARLVPLRRLGHRRMLTADAVIAETIAYVSERPSLARRSA